ncbi:MAG: molybdate ABC transporter substrate-binding protein [Rubricoccaceae bacterium]
MRAWWALLVVGLLASACAPSPDELVVFAAASLADVAHATADLQLDVPTRISVGPTSLLSQQIEQGAPVDVFLAAHPKWVERLEERGATHGDPVELARGRLVIVAGPNVSPARSASAALVGAPRIALADPSHVPAGEYAQAALRAVDVWDDVRDRILPVADVRAALVAVQRGAADAAIVYASDALATDELAVVYRFEASVTPDIRYIGVAVSNRPEAVAWVRQLESPEMQAVWQSHGFEPSQP